MKLTPSLLKLLEIEPRDSDDYKIFSKQKSS